MKTVISTKGQVVIPKRVREELGLTPGTVMKVRVEGRRIVLEAAGDPPREIFVRAGRGVTQPLLREAKETGDKTRRLLEDLGVQVE